METTNLLKKWGIEGIAVIHGLGRYTYERDLPGDFFKDLESEIGKASKHNHMVMFLLSTLQNYWYAEPEKAKRIRKIAELFGMERHHFRNPYHNGSKVDIYYGFFNGKVEYTPLPQGSRPVRWTGDIGDANASFPCCCGIQAYVPDDLPTFFDRNVAFSVIPVSRRLGKQCLENLSTHGFKPFLVSEDGQGLWWKKHDPNSKYETEDDD